MNRAWPKVRLGEILRRSEAMVALQPDAEYSEVTVRLWGKGVVLRRRVAGGEIAGTKRFVARAGQFILSRIDARNGAIGIVPLDLDGAIISSDFPVYDPVAARLDASYLGWLSKTTDFVELCKRASEGTTNRVRLQEERLLGFEVLLPPLAEQRRAVVRIEALAAKVTGVCRLQDLALNETQALLQSVLHGHFVTRRSGWRIAKMHTVVVVSGSQVDPTLPEYRKLPHISGDNMQSGTCRLLPYRTAEQDDVRSNNYLFAPETILYSKIRPYLRKAVWSNFRGLCSADVYPLRVINPDFEPRFIMWSMVAEPFTEYANRLSGRTRMPKLNRGQLLSFEIAYPTLSEQRSIVTELNQLREKVEALSVSQSNRVVRLAALMPSILHRTFRGER